jgi:hypothetical protein
MLPECPNQKNIKTPGAVAITARLVHRWWWKAGGEGRRTAGKGRQVQKVQ